VFKDVMHTEYLEDNLHMTFPPLETIKKIVSVLADPIQQVRRKAVQTIESCLKHGTIQYLNVTTNTDSLEDDLWMAFATPGTVQDIISMLADPVADVRQSMFQAIGCCLQHGEVQCFKVLPIHIDSSEEGLRTAFAKTEMVVVMMSMLVDPVWYLRRNALEVIVDFLTHSEIFWFTVPHK
jgi:hypothetical protein